MLLPVPLPLTGHQMLQPVTTVGTLLTSFVPPNRDPAGRDYLV